MATSYGGGAKKSAFGGEISSPSACNNNFLNNNNFQPCNTNLHHTIRFSIEVCAAAIFPELIMSFCITGRDTVNVGISFWDDDSPFELLFVCEG